MGWKQKRSWAFLFLLRSGRVCCNKKRNSLRFVVQSPSLVENAGLGSQRILEPAACTDVISVQRSLFRHMGSRFRCGFSTLRSTHQDRDYAPTSERARRTRRTRRSQRSHLSVMWTTILAISPLLLVQMHIAHLPEIVVVPRIMVGAGRSSSFLRWLLLSRQCFGRAEGLCDFDSSIQSYTPSSFSCYP